MTRTRLRLALPYLIGLVVAGVLYHSASRIEYVPRGDALGPDFWPKLAIGLMALVCAVETVRALIGAAGAQGIANLFDDEADDETPGQLHLLIGGILLITGYAILVPYVGFLLGSLFFMVAFMVLGRYRNHVAIWSISSAATVIAAFLFMRFAYVSLPRGVPPFDRFTDLLRILVGG